MATESVYYLAEAFHLQITRSALLLCCDMSPTPPTPPGGDRFVTEDDDPLISETGENFVPETN